MNTMTSVVRETSGRIVELSMKELAFYVCCAAFVLGNLALPRICHAAALGGQTWLPIYFFTLVGAWCFGWRVGLATALLSPLLNHFLFGMPAAGTLAVVLIKSSMIALCAGWLATQVKGSFGLLLGLLATVLVYQCLGFFPEMVLGGGLKGALQVLHTGWPGMLLQVAGGFLVIKGLQLLMNAVYYGR